MINIEDAYKMPLNDDSKTEGFLSAGRQGTHDESLAEVLKVRSNRDFGSPVASGKLT